MFLRPKNRCSTEGRISDISPGATNRHGDFDVLELGPVSIITRQRVEMKEIDSMGNLGNLPRDVLEAESSTETGIGIFSAVQLRQGATRREAMNGQEQVIQNTSDN